MKTTVILFLLSAFSAHADILTNEQKSAFAAYYRAWTQVADDFPQKQDTKAIFIDLDGDGIEEAIATYHGSFYETGWSWNAFRQNGQSWIPIKGHNWYTKVVDQSSNVYARPGEIFRVTHNNETAEFLILGEHFDKLAPEGLGPLNKIRFWIDDDGVLRQEKIENLERYLAYQGAHRNGLIKKLEVLKVEVFPGPQ